MAKQLLAEKKLTDTQRVEWLYAKVYNRKPTAMESQSAVAFVNDFCQERLASWQALCQALVSSNEFLYLK